MMSQENPRYEVLFKRLMFLDKQKWDGYRHREKPEVIAEHTVSLETRRTAIASELQPLEKEYPVLLRESNGDSPEAKAKNIRRIEVYERKTLLSQELAILEDILSSPDKIVISSRSVYGKSSKNQDSMKERHDICVALWGKAD